MAENRKLIQIIKLAQLRIFDINQNMTMKLKKRCIVNFITLVITLVLDTAARQEIHYTERRQYVETARQILFWFYLTAVFAVCNYSY
jgi:hypothetical protein